MTDSGAEAMEIDSAMGLESEERYPQYSRLENFVEGRRIGKGQFSEVFRATCTVDNSSVALKKVQVRRLVHGPHGLIHAQHKSSRSILFLYT